MREFNITLNNLHVAIENTMQQCEIALKELNKIRAENAADNLMQKFEDLINRYKGGAKP